MIITIVAFVVVLIVLVLVHELGHFFSAKACGVKVEELGIGFPPRLLGVKRGETVYSINAIPLGGFCKMAGEEDPDIDRSLASKSIGARVLVLSAGSLMNFIFPLILLSIAFMVPYNAVSGQVMVDEVSQGSPAAYAGIEAGDTILKVNDKNIYSTTDLARSIQLKLGEEVTVLVEHSDATTEEFQVVPRWRPPAEEGAIGVAISMEDAVTVKRSYPFWEAIPKGVVAGIESLVLFKNGIISMLIGAAPAGVAGPVGIAQLTGDAARAGISNLLEFAAFLSINLAIINILPLPALDGGRIVFVLAEWVRRGKRILPRTEGIIHLIGFALLIAFLVAVTYQDIIRIITGESLIP